MLLTECEVKGEQPLSPVATGETPLAVIKRRKDEFAEGKEENPRRGFSYVDTMQFILLHFVKKLFLLTA